MTITAAHAAPRILVHGHRGARAVLPENTLPAFEYAIEAGVDVLELDLAVTRDNVLVASHDPILPAAICSGGTGTRVIREMTFAELQRWDCGSKQNPGFPRQKAVSGARVPKLDDVLALASRGAFGFNIETKIFRDKPELTPSPGEFARLLVETVRRHRLESRVIIQSFDFRTLAAASRIAPEIRRSALFERLPADFVERTRSAPATILSPHYSQITPHIVTQARAAGLEVVPWTANRESDWEALVAARVDAIISDDPAALIAFLRRP
jgi:glycerophosphoryl diester phosphodiesterase